MSIRIGIAAELSPQEAGGVETNLHSLLHGLAGEPSGLEYRLLSPAGSLEGWRAKTQHRLEGFAWPFAIGGGNVEPPPMPGHWQAWWGRLSGGTVPGSEPFDRILRDQGIAAVHFPYPTTFPTSLPVVYEPWDLQHRHFPEFFTSAEIERRERVYGGGCRRAAVIITATRFTKRDVCAQYGVGRRRVAVIPRSSAQFQRRLSPEEKAAARRHHGLPEVFLFYPAMTFAHKNHVRLFEALRILREKHGRTVPLICSGRPHKPNHRQVLAECTARGLDGQVRFLGKVDDELMCALFSTATLMVFPSLFEGLGLPVLEAFHHHLPVTCARATCLPEVAGAGAEYFDPLQPEDIARGVLAVLDDPGRRIQLIAAGVRRLGHYGWDTAAPAFATAYKVAAGMSLNSSEQIIASRIFS